MINIFYIRCYGLCLSKLFKVVACINKLWWPCITWIGMKSRSKFLRNLLTTVHFTVFKYKNEYHKVDDIMSSKSRWKKGVICLVSSFPSWVMVFKLSKIVHFFQICAKCRNCLGPTTEILFPTLSVNFA